MRVDGLSPPSRSRFAHYHNQPERSADQKHFLSLWLVCSQYNTGGKYAGYTLKLKDAVMSRCRCNKMICKLIPAIRIAGVFFSRDINLLSKLAIVSLIGMSDVLFAYADSTANKCEIIDSTIIQLIKVSKNNNFRIVTKQGKEYVGTIKLAENGIELIGKEYRWGHYGNTNKSTILWADIDKIKIKPKETTNDKWVYILGVPIALLVVLNGL